MLLVRSIVDKALYIYCEDRLETTSKTFFPSMVRGRFCRSLYSSLRASIGSIEAARRAGMNPALAAQIPSAIVPTE